MPAIIRVRILAARGLPVMDRASEAADAFVEVKFGPHSFKTAKCPKTLNPVWNSDSFHIEADDDQLQDEPLQIRVLDYDVYSSHDAIGRVYVDLTPMLNTRGTSNISGWLPIFDSIHGIRGELNLVVSLDLFTNASRQKNSSCEVALFSSTCVPEGYVMVELYGLVEELVVDFDPEHKWIDKIRTARSSNDARQTLFSKLAGQVTRKMGVKVLELGGNSVLGYRQSLDLEGVSGVVIRGIGTAVLLHKISDSAPGSLGSHGMPWMHNVSDFLDEKQSSPPLDPISEIGTIHDTAARRSASVCEATALPSKDVVSEAKEGRPVPFFPDVSLSSDILSLRYIAPLGCFITLSDLPPGHVQALGGVVCAKSVKLIDKSEQEGHLLERDEWWQELRNEINSHMVALRCDAVLGYRETTTIHNDVCILAASGTAVLLSRDRAKSAPVAQPVSARTALSVDTSMANGYHDSGEQANQVVSCHMCHIPYGCDALPFPVSLHRCAVCKEAQVPELLLCTIDPPADLGLAPTLGETRTPRLIQARIVRRKADLDGEALAKTISDQLPFVEHDLHSWLVSKMRRLGYNAVFGLKMDLSVSDRFIIAIATGTGVSMPGMPAFEPAESTPVAGRRKGTSASLSPTPRKHDRLKEEDRSGSLQHGRSFERSQFVKQLDKVHEQDFHSILSGLPTSISVVNVNPMVLNRTCATLTTRPLHMVTRLSLQELSADTFDSRALTRLFERMIKTTLFKYRKMMPVNLCNASFGIMVPDEDEIQVSFNALVLVNKDVPPEMFACQRLPPRGGSRPSRLTREGSDSESSLDTIEQSLGSSTRNLMRGSISSSTGPFKPVRARLFRRISGSSHGDAAQPAVPSPDVVAAFEARVKPQSVLVTPLATTSAYPDHVVQAYLGYYDFFFIRETNSLREEGGLGHFVRSVVSEVVYTVQAHVVALGGNAILSFALSSNELLHTANHAQCIVHVSGDIVSLIPA